ncbi:MAG: transcriptional regulator [Alphaproteobacteria bacterium]|nr:MAG: transcriptional regulator [Alphaproteobacteria bacterium]
MDTMNAVEALRALAQERRLALFRLLVRCGDEGMAAGELARHMGVPHNTMSSQLAILARAGLVTAHREGRSIRYRVDLEGTRALLGFLTEDCCQGRPELCTPLAAGCETAQRTTQ